MRYAIVESGGKQYVAREGETIEVDRLPLEVGKPVEFDQVLLAADKKDVLVGNPLIKGAKVKAKVVDQIKAKKIIVFKYIPKQRYRRKAGHRQKYTRVIVDKISLPSGKKAAKKKSAEPKQAEKKKTPKKASAKSTKKKATAKKSTTKKSSSKTSGSSAPKKAGETKAKKSAAADKKKRTTSKKSASKSTKKSSDS